MTELVDVLQALQVWVFVVVAVVATLLYLRRGGRPAAWAAATFAVLGGVVLAGELLPEAEDQALLTRQLVIAVLVLFPYFLFRFGTSFRPAPRWVEGGAAAVTAVSVVAVFLLDDIPAEGEEDSTAFTVYSLFVVAAWAVLSAYTAVVLWRSGRGRPTVLRWRMRTLGLGALGIVVALLISVAVPDDDDERHGLAELLSAVVVLATGPLFLAALAPPQLLLALWRRREVDALYDAEASLMAATTSDQVAAGLLPHVAGVLGGTGASLVADDGTIIAHHGLPAAAEGATAMSVPLRAGHLTVTGDAYTPYFGHQETVLLERIARLTDVALRRAEVTERERRAAEDLRAANDAMRSFVAVASHDLRTPIAGIRGFAELLETQWDSLDDDRKRSYLATIVRQSGHVSAIVSDLLTVSRLDSGSLELAPEPVAVAPLVGAVVADLAVPEAIVDVDPGCVVASEPDHVERMLRNLVENALHYGAPPVEITARTVGDAVELRVRDHGEGVPEAFEEHLFERFARADQASSRAKHGTGLGLAIVRGLARTSSGDAWFERVRPGACFVVRLPRHEETA